VSGKSHTLNTTGIRNWHTVVRDNRREKRRAVLGACLLTPWCRFLLEQLTGLQLVKKFPAFYGTRRFITVLTSVRHLSLSWDSPIQSIYPHPTSWRSVLILSTHLRLGLLEATVHKGRHCSRRWRRKIRRKRRRSYSANL
jgi:hypothetical protein